MAQHLAAPLPADAATNATAWNAVAGLDNSNGLPANELTRFEWTGWPGHGPGIDILGDLSGAHVAELGCGTGEHAAMLPRHGTRAVYGVDVAPARVAQARRRWRHVPGIVWIDGEAAAVLPGLPPLEVCYSIYGALWYAAPGRLLPAIGAQLVPHGLLAFSANAPRAGEPSGQRVDNLTIDGVRMPVIYYTHTAEQWQRLLTAHGFTDIRALTVAAPGGGPYTTLVVTARRS
ncbi:class I SAM-dependent methyltransferase [Nonomuraea sp. NN258]|uniref:methyltransferase domain-containing protein n=1 Tax=Nonomuraea antri TaxID=2730852 RepID=UPI00156A3662|nr:class I SAM-dependent methyltransferase [Nonomuraea antri]NRQ39384.1 class I SAM-dependent methyltransferase [Nonomuraea antri]